MWWFINIGLGCLALILIGVISKKVADYEIQHVIENVKEESKTVNIQDRISGMKKYECDNTEKRKKRRNKNGRK